MTWHRLALVTFVVNLTLLLDWPTNNNLSAFIIALCCGDIFCVKKSAEAGVEKCNKDENNNDKCADFLVLHILRCKLSQVALKLLQTNHFQLCLRDKQCTACVLYYNGIE